jgi:hypothetical protein
MTESEWLAETDSHKLLRFVVRRRSERKLRLCAVAFGRLLAHLMDAVGHAALSESEHSADGLTSKKKLRMAQQSAQVAYLEVQTSSHANTAMWTAVWSADWRTRFAASQTLTGVQMAAERDTAANDLLGSVLRAVFNPFRTAAAAHPTWLVWQNGTVAQLAQAAYDERQLPEGTLDPTRLSLLADVLEDAGCSDAELLGHLRGPGPHVRGCWAQDHVLSKS